MNGRTVYIDGDVMSRMYAAEVLGSFLLEEIRASVEAGQSGVLLEDVDDVLRLMDSEIVKRTDELLLLLASPRERSIAFINASRSIALAVLAQRGVVRTSDLEKLRRKGHAVLEEYYNFITERREGE